MGTRRRYSKIKVPDKLRDFVGEDSITIEHYDEGISANEIPYWSAFYQIKNDDQKKKGG